MTPPPCESVPSRRSQAFSLLASPAAFVIVAAFNYFVAPAACQLGLLQAGSSGNTLLGLIGLVVTLAGLGVTVWAGYTAHRNWNQAQAAGAGSDTPARFMAAGGIMVSALFIALTIFVGLSGLALAPCHPA